MAVKLSFESYAIKAGLRVEDWGRIKPANVALLEIQPSKVALMELRPNTG